MPRHAIPTKLCLTWLIMAGCGETGSAPPARTDPAIQDARSEALDRKQLARVPPERPAAMKGEVPENVMTRIRGQLAARTGAADDTIEVVRAEARQWPNGAMGCPQPGMSYTQAIVPGYWIVLRHDGRDYDYRVAESGHYVICEGVLLEQPPTR